MADFFGKSASNSLGRRKLKFADIADSLRSLRYVLRRKEGYVATDGHGWTRIKLDMRGLNRINILSELIIEETTGQIIASGC